MLAITYTKNNKNKGSRMGHTKKIFKKKKNKKKISEIKTQMLNETIGGRNK
jgi:hypothetical protein